MIHSGKSFIIGGGAEYPMAFIVCENCAYVREFMAVPIGLVSDEPRTPAPPPPPDVSSDKSDG
jgi:hypothetical protein